MVQINLLAGPPRHAHGDLTSLAPHERLPEILVVPRRETGLILRCAGKAGYPFQTTQGSSSGTGLEKPSVESRAASSLTWAQPLLPSVESERGE